MFPPQSDAIRMTTIEALRIYYALPDELWRSFTQVAGDPGNDMRLLAVLPSTVVTAALERPQLADGSYLSAVQASHVGLVYNLAKRIQHTHNGGNWDSWTENSPFGSQITAENTVTKAIAEEVPTRKLKLSSVLDQSDDSEFAVQSEEMRAKWYSQYVMTVGGLPPEEEDPSLEQLSALQKRLVVQDTAPFVDFAVFVPYGQKALKAARFRTYVLTGSGT